MRLDLSILALPASILALIALHNIKVLAAEDDQSPKQWPYNLPPHVKYWPEDPPNRRRDLEAIEEHLRLGRNPVGVMKMSTDEGEKFYMEYWQFEGETRQTDILEAPSMSLRRREDEEARLLANTSADLLFRPRFVLHSDDFNTMGLGDMRARRSWGVRNDATVSALLEKRGFVCPTGTANCSAIGYSNSCCATDETCFAIQDTGLGPVGCCPNGSTCGGTITTCNAPNTPCADNMGGGCCIPNYVCAGVGCVLNSSLIVTTVITQTAEDVVLALDSALQELLAHLFRPLKRLQHPPVQVGHQQLRAYHQSDQQAIPQHLLNLLRQEHPAPRAFTHVKHTMLEDVVEQEETVRLHHALRQALPPLSAALSRSSFLLDQLLQLRVRRVHAPLVGQHVLLVMEEIAVRADGSVAPQAVRRLEQQVLLWCKRRVRVWD
ncbi:hypothetical protein EG329_013146 [Mollisiaceae sp. DMI_Dod_QoI]|nr:hypothetical protein EG329_013146 [Helotiales sp. DMI_Dod_QoI]